MHLLVALQVANQDFQNQLNNIPDPGKNVHSTVKQTGRFFGFVPDHHLLVEFNSFNKIITILGIMGALFGAYLIIRSSIGNNGQQRRHGAAWLITSVMAIFLFRILPVLALSAGQLTNGRFLNFSFTLIAQIVFFVGAPLSYMLGSQWLQLYEFSSQPTLLRRSQRAYQNIQIIMIVGVVIYVLMEML